MPKTLTLTCDYCGAKAELVTGTAIYPHRPDLANLDFWRCAPCEAWVGCHKEGATFWENGKKRPYPRGTPLGRLANHSLRKAKHVAHAAFDPLWKSRRMTRREGYAWLAAKLGIPEAKCHIGMFDDELCYRTVKICTEETNGPV